MYMMIHSSLFVRIYFTHSIMCQQLTRTNLELIPSSKVIYFMGNQVSTTMADEDDSVRMDLRVIYLDSDICVSMIGGDKDNLQVYTKNEAWIESRKEKVSDLCECVAYHCMIYIQQSVLKCMSRP